MLMSHGEPPGPAWKCHLRKSESRELFSRGRPLGKEVTKQPGTRCFLALSIVESTKCHHLPHFSTPPAPSLEERNRECKWECGREESGGLEML